MKNESESTARAHRRRLLMPTLISTCVLFVCMGCLWDYDTLRAERSRFPEVLELITGKFPRHSKDFYLWRIQDRRQRLDQSPDDLSLMDDLAVAYDKTGASSDAIALGLRMLEKEPERYETLANLGTFYLHAGDFDKGLSFIEKAIVVNPNAHFGREKIQLQLAKYVLSKQKDGKVVLPLAEGPASESFVDFMSQMSPHTTHRSSRWLDDEELKEGIAGVTGMMRFSKHDSPILLEALGDLLGGSHTPRTDAKLLAVRAYLGASYAVNDESVREKYRIIARTALKNGFAGTPDNHYLPYKELTFEAVEEQFKKELNEGVTWYSELQANEKTWIDAGGDVEAKFDATYRTIPKIESESAAENRSEDFLVPNTFRGVRTVAMVVVFICVIAVLVVAIVLIVKHISTKR